ncbi:MAG: enoyl-CoA hydratase/carnithine racemase [Candidatus Azotimanducaceae bacterium]|jgi:enoyl-CoA hydratase/carnithine racemase
MIDLTREGNVFLLTMNDGENRWNTTFVREFAEALDEVEASEGPASLVTTSAMEKFFSNGLDLEWRGSEDANHRGGDREAFGAEFMYLMGRIITLPVPTIAAVNGHAFGAGFMCALCHDNRFQRADRGFMCANEVDIGMVIPNPKGWYCSANRIDRKLVTSGHRQSRGIISTWRQQKGLQQNERSGVW